MTKFLERMGQLKMVETVTLLVLAGGLWFAYDQAKKIEESITVFNRNNSLNTWNSIAARWLLVDRVIVEHPNVRKYLFQKAAISESDQDYDKAWDWQTWYWTS
jgi:hypothetical protein